jgi:hypothetical protein
MNTHKSGTHSSAQVNWRWQGPRLECKGDRGRAARGQDGDKSCNNIVVACETTVDRIDNGDCGFKPHRVPAMSADETGEKTAMGTSIGPASGKQPTRPYPDLAK